MKKIICVIACSGLMGFSPIFGQLESPGGLVSFDNSKPSNGLAKRSLATFDLKFPGGGPKDLVKAIEAASGTPLNVIINKQDEDVEIPPLKMTGVNVAQLFQALEPMSVKNVDVVTTTSWSTATTSYGFKTAGDLTENSIWYFHVQRPSSPPPVSREKLCRFVSLAPYLDHGFTVDDITTAIQTGWKMAKVSSPPELNYHKETMLLMAFGDPVELKTIDDVLHTLPSSNATRNELDSMHQEIKYLQGKVTALVPPAAR